MNFAQKMIAGILLGLLPCLSFAAEIEMTFGLPASAIAVTNRDSNDQIASTSGVLLGIDVVSSRGDIAGSAISQSAIGPKDALVLSATGFGLTFALDKLMISQSTDSAGVSIDFRPATHQTFGLLVCRSRYDLSASKELPDDVIFLGDAPITSGSFMAVHLRYGLHRRLGNQFLSTHFFADRSISSPGQGIAVQSFGISLSVRMNIFSAI